MQYEDLGFKPLLPILNPLLNSIGLYKGLKYSGFNGVNSSPSISGIQPSSGSNAIVGGLVQNVLDGTSSFTDQYTGSKSKGFKLNSFSFACATKTDLLSLAGAPRDCVVTATAFKGGKQVASQQFTFKPTSGGGGGLLGTIGSLLSTSKMAKAVPNFKTFGVVEKVQFTTDNPVLNALIIDDVNYVFAYCK